jgi:ribosomal protein S18 acetylase RimI-like enzyme
MDDATLRRRMWASLERLQRMLALHGKGGTLYEDDEIVAAVVAGVPEASLVNAALPRHPGGPSREAIQRVADAYAERDLRKWGVWIDPAVHDSTPLVDAGLILDSTPAGMAAPLADLEGDGTEPVPSTDPLTAARVNDLTYGHGDDRLERALGRLPPETVHGYRADGKDGDPVSVLMVCDTEGDAAVWFVATVPWAQRQGHAQRLLRRALYEARERGCTTTSLQASQAGRPVYERVGYRTLGDLELWERRR